VTDAKLINWIHWISGTSCNVKTRWRWFTMHCNRRQVAIDVRDVRFLKFGCTGSKNLAYIRPNARCWVTIFENIPFH